MGEEYPSQLEPERANLKVKKYQARNLKKELKDLAKGMKESKEQPWKVRVQKISDLGGMCMAQAVDAEEFADAVHKEVGRTLAEQVLDLRSQIVKRICMVIVVMSEELGVYFNRTFSMMLVSPLIKQTAVKALPIKVSAWECLQVVMSHRTIPKAIAPIVDESVSKEKIIRQRSCELVAYMCENWDVEVLQKHMNVLLTCIQERIEEADETVRTNSRYALISLSRNFPRAVVEFMREIDPRVIKLMEPDLPEDVQAEVAQQFDLDGGASYNSTGSRGSRGSRGAKMNPTRRSAGAIANSRSRPSRSASNNAAYEGNTLSPTRPAVNRRSGGSGGAASGRARATSAVNRSNTISTPTSGRSTSSARAGAGSASAARAMAAMDNLVDDNLFDNDDLRRTQSDQPQEYNNTNDTASPQDLLARLQELRAEVLNIQGGR